MSRRYPETVYRIQADLEGEPIEILTTNPWKAEGMSRKGCRVTAETGVDLI